MNISTLWNANRKTHKMNTLRLQIPSIPENIKVVESYIDNIKEKYKLNDDMYGNVMVAVVEAVNNAILHGNGGDKTKLVTLDTYHDENAVRFEVSDEGNGFDYAKLPDPTDSQNIMKTGGRGIYIIRFLSDEFQFKNNGATLEMTFFI